jgi:hypothetical protein
VLLWRATARIRALGSSLPVSTATILMKNGAFSARVSHLRSFSLPGLRSKLPLTLQPVRPIAITFSQSEYCRPHSAAQPTRGNSCDLYGIHRQRTTDPFTRTTSSGHRRRRSWRVGHRLAAIQRSRILLIMALLVWQSVCRRLIILPVAVRERSPRTPLPFPVRR